MQRLHHPTCSSLFTQARNGGALSHSLVMSHCEGFSMDWHSWSLTCPGTDATWLQQLLVRLQELLLGAVVDVDQQDDPEPGAVEHGLGDTLRRLSRPRTCNTFGRGGHPAHISFAEGEGNVGRVMRRQRSSIVCPSP